MSKRIPSEILEEIRSSVDIIDVIGEQVSLRKTGKNFNGLCPFHQEKTPSFSVAQDKQVYNCFGCGASGNVVTFLMESKGYTFYEAIFDLAKRSGKESLLGSYQPQSEHTTGNHKKLYEIHDILAKLYSHYLLNSDDGSEARAYLEKRQLSEESINSFQIGYAPGKDLAMKYLVNYGYELEELEEAGVVVKSENGIYMDSFRNRLIFPIHDELGRVVAFSGRIMGEGHPKYINSKETPIFHKNRVLYNFDRARPEMKKTGTVVLFEGFMDVISAHEAGVINGIATMGTSFSIEHMQLIGKNLREIKLCFDGDKAGEKATSITGRLLVENGYQVSICVLPTGMDPDEYIKQFGKESFKNQIILGAITYISYQLEYLKKDKNLERAEDFGEYLEEALKIISQVKNEFVQEGYIQSLSLDTKISSQELKDKLNGLKPVSQRRQSVAKEPTGINAGINRQRSLSQFTARENAERFLIGYMLKSAEVAERVKHRIYQSFNIPEHQAIATLLYAFYEEGNTFSLEKFLGEVNDGQLRSIVLDISEIPLQEEISQPEFDDYCHIILVDATELKWKEKIKKEIEEAERNHEYIRAAELIQELALKKTSVLIPMKN